MNEIEELENKLVELQQEERRRLMPMKHHMAIGLMALLANEPGMGSKSIPKEDKPTPITRSGIKVGRNQSCPCGSGRKYKKCCLKK